MTDLPDDFRDMLVELAIAGADFVIVGGFAVAFHGHPRTTKDLDIFVRPTPANANRVYAALASFGAPLQAFDVAEADFADYGGVLQIGVAPIRIGIINRIAGVGFDEALPAGDSLSIAGHRIPVIGREALIKNKRAVGRLQDLADVEALSRQRPP
jgi:hypothetical protein